MSLYLAFDGGGTKTRAGLYDERLNLLDEAAAGPSNPCVYGYRQSVDTLLGLARKLVPQGQTIDTVAVGLSGVGRSAREMAATFCGRVPAKRAIVTGDLQPILFANAAGRAAFVVVAGTGSTVMAQDDQGQMLALGSYGTLLGDEGSAYQLAVAGLRAVSRAYDGAGPPTLMVEKLRKTRGFSRLGELAIWTYSANKQELAELAQVVTAAAQEGDTPALEIITEQSSRLAQLVCACQAKLGIPGPAHVFLQGGMLKHCPIYRKAFEDALAEKCPELQPAAPQLLGHRAAVEMVHIEGQCPWAAVAEGAAPEGPPMPPTEELLGEGRYIDEMDATGIVRAMNHEDAHAAQAVASQEAAIARAVEAAAEAVSNGGRIIYLGAGTSGRLGVLDASECPPTFGVSPDTVIGIIAGGEAALRTSVEGAEDDTTRAITDLDALSPPLGSADFLVAIASSGTTPYALAGLHEARRRGATSVLLCCNPLCTATADIVIAVPTGPEVLAGSTRLKAGTATKMVLNMLSTGAMALTGRVFEGRMVGMRPVNEKLRRRAAGIVAAITGKNAGEARELLREAGDNIAVAVLMAIRNISAAQASEQLKQAGGSLRAALKRD